MNLRSLKDGKLIYNLESNHKLRQSLTDKVLPQRRELFVPIGNNFSAPVKLLFPAEMSLSVKYPMIVMVSGSPGSQYIKSRSAFFIK